MTMNARDTKALIASADKAMLISFVTDCTAYQTNSARLDKLKDEQAELISKNGELRKSIVPVFKALGAHKWNAIKTDIKTAIEEAKISDVDGLLGVLKTAFEYKILPTQANADRLRKAKTWVNWAGIVVPNTYKKVHAEKAPEPAPTSEPTAQVPTVPAEPQTTQSAPTPLVQPKPAVKGSPESISVNVSAPDMDPADLWVQACTQFMNFKLTAIAFEEIEKRHKLEAGTLLKELVEARRVVTESTKKNGAKHG